MASKKNKMDDATIKEIDALFANEKQRQQEEETKLSLQDMNKDNSVSLVPMAFPVKKQIHIFDWCNVIGIRRIQ